MPIETKQQRERAVLEQLLADLRADEFHPLQLRPPVVAFELGHHLLGQLRARDALLHRQPDQHVARELPKLCTRASAKPSLSMASRMLVESAACA